MILTAMLDIIIGIKVTNGLKNILIKIATQNDEQGGQSKASRTKGILTIKRLIDPQIFEWLHSCDDDIVISKNIIK